MPPKPNEYRATTDRIMHCATCGDVMLIVECGLLCEKGCGRIMELPDWVELDLLKAAWPERCMKYREPITRKPPREDVEPLFDYAERNAVISREKLASRFRAWSEFHKNNPHVWKLFLKFAAQAKEAGRERFGARMILERLRWYTSVETVSADRFKINDHHVPYYSRLAMLLYPDEYGELFERRDPPTFDASDQDILDAHHKHYGCSSV